MDPDAPVTTPPPSSSSSPSIFRWTLGFLLVGFAWGFTTPFMRRAALAQQREREQEQLKAKQYKQQQKQQQRQQQQQADNVEEDNDNNDDSDDEAPPPPPPPPPPTSSSAPITSATTSRATGSKGTGAGTGNFYLLLLRDRLLSILTSVLETLRRPAYAVPLLVNVTGSVWFFLLVGQAELSLTVPITNSLAFLFTVLGEWFAEGKVISKNTWLGMSLVLVGIALCVHSKL